MLFASHLPRIHRHHRSVIDNCIRAYNAKLIDSKLLHRCIDGIWFEQNVVCIYTPIHDHMIGKMYIHTKPIFHIYIHWISTASHFASTDAARYRMCKVLCTMPNDNGCFQGLSSEKELSLSHVFLVLECTWWPQPMFYCANFILKIQRSHDKNIYIAPCITCSKLHSKLIESIWIIIN